MVKFLYIAGQAGAGTPPSEDGGPGTPKPPFPVSGGMWVSLTDRIQERNTSDGAVVRTGPVGQIFNCNSVAGDSVRIWCNDTTNLLAREVEPVNLTATGVTRQVAFGLSAVGPSLAGDQNFVFGAYLAGLPLTLRLRKVDAVTGSPIFTSNTQLGSADAGVIGGTSDHIYMVGAGFGAGFNSLRYARLSPTVGNVVWNLTVIDGTQAQNGYNAVAEGVRTFLREAVNNPGTWYEVDTPINAPANVLRQWLPSSTFSGFGLSNYA